MPQGEKWFATEQDKLRAEAFWQTPSGKRFYRETRDRCMRNTEFRIARGLYTPTEQDLRDLEEWRKEVAAREPADGAETQD